MLGAGRWRQQGATVLCRTPHQCVLALSRLITGNRCLLAWGGESQHFPPPLYPGRLNTGATGAYCVLRVEVTPLSSCSAADTLSIGTCCLLIGTVALFPSAPDRTG